MNCTRCQGTGFLNVDQLPDDVAALFDDVGVEAVIVWLSKKPETDVAVCDCCGDGETWYGEPGQHYGPSDQPGPQGPYVSNGGLCKCH